MISESSIQVITSTSLSASALCVFVDKCYINQLLRIGAQKCSCNIFVAMAVELLQLSVYVC